MCCWLVGSCVQGVELHRLKQHIDPVALDFLPYHFLLVSGGRYGHNACRILLFTWSMLPCHVPEALSCMIMSSVRRTRSYTDVIACLCCPLPCLLPVVPVPGT